MDVIVTPQDMSVEEKECLREFKNSGCPGLTKLQDSQVTQWFLLYMAGKSYVEIAQITQSKKDLILYISERNKWIEHKLKHYQGIANHLAIKASQAKIDGANIVCDLITSLNKYYEQKMDAFLKTNDSKIIENLDIKQLNQYLKALETLEKLMGNAYNNSNEDNEKNKHPINVNVYTGNQQQEIEQISENTIDIKPTSFPGKKLKELALLTKTKNKNNK